MVFSEVQIMKTDKTIGKSAEDYLESMLILKEKNGYIRSVDISDFLGVTKPSVSAAMKHLREKNHITVTDEGFIYLTDSGKEIADMIYTRHEILSSFLVNIGVAKEIAEEDACKIEHVISAESFDALRNYLTKTHCL